MNFHDTLVITYKTLGVRKMSREQLTMPVVALRGLTIFPEMIIHFDLSRKQSKAAVEKAMLTDQTIFLVTQKNSEANDINFDSVYHIGTIAKIKQVMKLPSENIRVLVEGERKAEFLQATDEKEYLEGICSLIATVEDVDEEHEEAMSQLLKEMFSEFCSYYQKGAKGIVAHVEEMTDLEDIIKQIAISSPFHYDKKQKILETVSLTESYHVIADILQQEIQVARIKAELADNVKQKLEKNQRDYILREQLSYLKEELGEKADTSTEAEEFRKMLSKLKASKKVKERIDKSIKRFESIAGSSAESVVERTYLQNLLEMPWDKASKDSMDLVKAEKILNEDHYGLEKVKERMIEFLAVRILTKKGTSPIICLTGPPGTGKTSIAKSVARALNKKYVRISLGGIRDEAEIRGHRKTYIGSMPGRIAMAVKEAGVKNPLMLLDEIDKIGSDFKGDTASALLEVLDSAQNLKFRDHYLEIPIDLSEVLFITTANDLSKVAQPLKDRMEIIEVSGYTANEKFHIAKEHLAGKQRKKHGLLDKQLVISDKAIRDIIKGYTREAGVRELERKIGQICRKSARNILENSDTQIRVSGNNLESFLGKPKYTQDKINKKDEAGVVRGLAWTSVGGDTLEIEVNVMPGKGHLVLTGKLGDTMKESAKTGLSYIRSIAMQYEIPVDYFEKHDIHIHVPEGAVPKDGPSAGITMATAVLSAITGIKVNRLVAMTGEITLRGRVLPIGGLKEKTLAAKEAGIKTILIPSENQKDIEEIADEIKDGLSIIPVENMNEVIRCAFT